MKKTKKPKKKQFVAYYRVSTQRQSIGLSAQKTAVKKYLKKAWPPIQTFTEKESGKKADRPELNKALDYCYENKATLIVASLDRLSRDLHFITCIEQAKIDFVCCDFPNMDRLQLHLLGSIAQWEREQISKRTSRALQELKSRGYRFGAQNPKTLKGLKKLWKAKRKAKKEREKLREKELAKALATGKPLPKQKISKMEQDDAPIVPMLKILREEGYTYQAIAESFQKHKVPMRRGGNWTAVQANKIALRNGIT